MTDIEFATCDLEHIDELELESLSTRGKKFYELKYNDSIYAILVNLQYRHKSFVKYEFKMKGMEKPAQTDPNNPKARLYNIYFDDPVPGFQRRGIQADKNRSSVVKYKDIKKGSIYFVIYGTSLEECIERTEKTLHIPVEDKLEWGFDG